MRWFTNFSEVIHNQLEEELSLIQIVVMYFYHTVQHNGMYKIIFSNF